MKEKDKEVSLGKIELINWTMLIVLSLLGYAFYDLFIAKSVFVGGILANVSFWFLKRDLTRLFRVPVHGVKARFFIRYYTRFSVLVIILYLLIKFRAIDPLGLLVGLSTVLLSVGMLMTGATKKICLNVKEAS